MSRIASGEYVCRRHVTHSLVSQQLRNISRSRSLTSDDAVDWIRSWLIGKRKAREFGRAADAGKRDKKTPGFGWCTGSHRPKKPAQTGYRGRDGKPYCKLCFRERHPKLYKAKQLKRKKDCGLCGVERMLRGGFCKACRSARACDVCGDINMDCSAQRCSVCSSRWPARGARFHKLALWCTTCTTLEERGAERCRSCYNHPKLYKAEQLKRKKVCGLCGLERRLRGGFCRACRSARACGVCGEINMDCSAQPCSVCSSRCSALGARFHKLALWCTTCTTLEERQAERCRSCYKHTQGRA